VIGYSVERRTVGLRMALGALPGDVLGAVLKEGLTPVAVGIACGVPGAAMAAGAVRGLLFGVGPLDPAVLGSAAGGLLRAGAPGIPLGSSAPAVELHPFNPGAVHLSYRARPTFRKSETVRISMLS